jgi:hypothetical protein
MSAPVQSYRFDHVNQATVRLDEAARMWFMYYRTDGGYGVMTAPAERSSGR